MSIYGWIIVMVVLLMIEAATVGLTTIWFAIGALVAAFASIFVDSLLVQLGIFVVVSVIALIAVRPTIADKLKKINEQNKTGIDTYIGSVARVEERIDNFTSQGCVFFDGKSWTARSTKDDVTFEKDEKVVIERIEGVTLFVRKEQ